MKIAIIDIGMGNLTSVKNAINCLGESADLIQTPDDLSSADRIILPGVGAFGDAMTRLNDEGWIPILKDEILSKEKPFLGICLGMQVLATQGKEHGDFVGLGWIPGVVERLQGSENHRVPHIGWNDVVFQNNASMYREMGESGTFYFVHSYVLHPNESEIISGICDYCQQFAASIQMKNIWATQFHPEKSQKAGLRVLKNFIMAKR